MKTDHGLRSNHEIKPWTFWSITSHFANTVHVFIRNSRGKFEISRSQKKNPFALFRDPFISCERVLPYLCIASHPHISRSRFNNSLPISCINWHSRVTFYWLSWFNYLHSSRIVRGRGNKFQFFWNNDQVTDGLNISKPHKTQTLFSWRLRKPELNTDWRNELKLLPFNFDFTKFERSAILFHDNRAWKWEKKNFSLHKIKKKKDEQVSRK